MRRRRYKRKIIFGSLFLALLILTGVIAWLVYDKGGNNDDVSDDESSGVEQSEDNREESDESKEKNEEAKIEKEKEKEEVEKYEGEDPNSADDLSGAVTYAEVNGANLVIRVNIDQYLDAGKCELTLSRGGATIYSSIADISGGAATSSCEGFDVPVNVLGEGAIEITINLNADGRNGVIRGEANI